jgi:hypothetical protein
MRSIIHHVGAGDAFVEVGKGRDAAGVVGEERGGADDPELRAHLRQQPHVGAGDPAVADVAADRHLEPLEPALAAAHGESVEQCLGRVLTGAVPRVDHRAVHGCRDFGWGARVAVADHHYGGLHRIKGQRGVDQALALVHGGSRDVEVRHRCAKPQAGDLEGEEGTGRIFKEDVELGQALEPFIDLARPAVERGPAFRLVEQEKDVVAGKLLDAQQVAVGEVGHSLIPW